MKASIRDQLARGGVKALLNGLLAGLGVRLVNRNWGPRGIPEVLRELKESGFSPRVVLDAGSADGTWTRLCARSFPSARYALVDPRPGAEAAARDLVSEGLNVSFWNGALGRVEGTLPFFLHGDQSSLLPSEFNRSTESSASVPVVPLDDLVKRGELPAPQLVKIDVQGAELDLLMGAKESLRGVDYLLVEVSFQEMYDGQPLAGEVVSFLHREGFAIAEICTYVQRPLDGRLAQTDLLFGRRDGPWFSRKGYAR